MSGGPDQRDSQTWVVIELTRAGEVKVEESLLAGLLRKALAVGENHPVFIPSLSYMAGNRRTTLHLMQGYAFVGSGLPEVQYYNLEGVCPYVKRVLSSKSPSGMRVLSVIPDDGVRDMRKQLAEHVSSDVVEGMHVTVTEGVYAHMDGEIVDVAGSNAHVRFILRSIDIITSIPKVFLTPKDAEDMP
jgi:hypothetical protein